MLVIITGLSYIAVNTGIRHIEQAGAEDTTGRFLLLLEREIDSLNQSTREWAVWTDTWNFLDGYYPGFTKDNLKERFFSERGLSWLLFYDATGRLVLSVQANLTEHPPSTIPPAGFDEMLKRYHLTTPMESDMHRSGLLPFGDIPILVSAYPVLKNDGSGPVKGTVVGVRILDQVTTDQMGQYLPGQFTFSVIPPDQLNPSMKNESVSKIPYELDDEIGVLNTNTVIRDIEGKPAFLFSLKYPLYGPVKAELISILMVVIISGFLCFGIAVYYGFTRFFISQIRKISENLVIAAESGEVPLKCPSDLSADLSSLSGTTDRVLSTLEKKQKIFARTEYSQRAINIRWETLFISAAEEILIGDEDGPLICNPRFEETIGVSSHNIIGMKIEDLPFNSIIGDGIHTLQEIWDQEKMDGEHFIWKIYHEAENADAHNEVILDANLQFVEMDGRKLRFLIAHNITEEMRLRDEQEIAIRQIDRNLGQLAALNDEIRNPLTLIAAWTELDNPPSRAKIMEGVRRIDEIIDRIDNGYVESEKVRKYLHKSIEGYRVDRDNHT
ncbi:MAG: CHASE4 domain-containing protein [Methanobacteriota archaeon]